MVTQSVDDDELLLAYVAGIDNLLIKPVGRVHLQVMLEATLRLVRTMREHAHLLDLLPLGVLEIDSLGSFLSANKHARQVLGMQMLAESHDTLGAWLARHARAEHAPTRQVCEDLAQLQFERYTGRETEVHLLDPLGEPHVLLLRLLRSPTPEGLLYIVMLQDVTQNYQATQSLYTQSRRDLLTGLANRLALIEAYGQRSHSGRSALLLLDLDGFKLVNDTLGHPVGDEVLRTVARRLAGAVGQGDVLARLGGDEFVLLLQDMRESANATLVAERLIQTVNQPITIDGQPCKIGASVGVCQLQPDTSLDEALAHADLGLYAAKHAGRNRVGEYEASQTGPA
jgi:diguanylate cyclase (GGDEF)-like protein